MPTRRFVVSIKMGNPKEPWARDPGFAKKKNPLLDTKQMSLSGTIRMDCSDQTWWDRMWGHKKCKWDMSGGLLLNGQPLQMHPQA
jgi:hypothetical protein